MGRANLTNSRRDKAVEMLLKFMFVILTVCASMGEWKYINAILWGLPKAICLGVICIAFAYAFIRPDIKRVKQVLIPLAVYMALIAALMLWSVAIWIMNFSEISSISRGGSKMMYQTICVFTAVSAVYLFGRKAVDLFALSLCITNGLIMLFEIPNYGLSASINSLINCVVKFGDAVGYSRALEIHDLTFVFGQLIIYYAVFAPKKRAEDKKTRRRLLIACTFFFIVGMKRIAIPAVILFILIGAVLKNRKKLTAFFVISGICTVIFFLFFVYGVRTGAVSKICNAAGIDMMGREYLWQLAGPYYRFSPSYMGQGFEFVDKIVVEWYNAGLINHAYPFHNDILKVFVELGFPGFLIWSVIQYILYPIFFSKYADTKAAALYVSVLGYMTITYLTDNTAFYFWSTLSLKLIVLGYAFYRKETREDENAAWTPPSKNDIKELMANMMREA